MKLAAKISVVTGASTGIGQAIAVGFSQEGATVYLTARSEAGLKETKKLIEANGGKAEILPSDLSQSEDIKKLIAKIKSLTKKVDIFANVAGIWYGAGEVYARKDYQTFDQKVILDTYMVGTVAPSLLIHGLLPLMPERGKILNISGTFTNGAKG